MDGHQDGSVKNAPALREFFKTNFSEKSFLVCIIITVIGRSGWLEVSDNGMELRNRMARGMLL